MKKIVLTEDRLRKSAETEARLLCTLRHNNIVSYQDCFTDATKRLCIVMEYCDAGDLAEQIIDAKRNAGRFSEPQVVDWTFQICQALKVRIHSFYSGQCHVLHRPNYSLSLTKSLLSCYLST